MGIYIRYRIPAASPDPIIAGPFREDEVEYHVQDIARYEGVESVETINETEARGALTASLANNVTSEA